mmetsp:Transcript_13766/g.19233  ORF Transcript_13766/g.19233 Transcript_13766/m.19233 type:complete len:113 (+) Transcript_13766:61-399(+)
MNSNMNQYSSEMLASSIMLMSICEHSEIRPGYKPASNSKGSLPGWGNSMTRRSYKINLCSLADQQEQQEPQNQHHEPHHKQRFLENCASPQQPKRTRTTTTTTTSSTTGWFR